MRWASGFLGQTNLTGEFQRVLTGETGLDAHTIKLTVLDGREVVYIACRDSGDPLGLTFRIGMRLPAPYTATGKALLAAMPPDDLDRLFADPRSWPSPLTARGVGSLDQLRRELDLVRRRGYSLDDGEVREGMICVGAAIRDHSSCAIAGIAVSLIRSQASVPLIEKLGERVRSAADAITRQLGH